MLLTQSINHPDRRLSASLITPGMNRDNSNADGIMSAPFALKVTSEPTDRRDHTGNCVPQHSGAVIEPHLIVELSGQIKDDVRFNAFAEWRLSPGGHLHRALGEEMNRQDGEYGSVDFKWEDIRITEAGIYSFHITVYEATPDGPAGLLYVADVESMEFTVA